MFTRWMIPVIGTSCLATIDAGAVAKGAGQAQPAPADLREMAGQPVEAVQRRRLQVGPRLFDLRTQ